MKNTTSKCRISFVGSGNVATQLALAFFAIGFDVVEIFSHHFKHAELLAKKVGAKAVSQLYEMDATVDFCIVAVPDSKIKIVVDGLPIMKGIVAHTSGITPMDIMFRKDRVGVFYPLQTFSKDIVVDFEKIPFCIEGNSPKTGKALFRLAENLSQDVRFINSEQRKYLHLAAVFVNNFTNHMYHIAEDILASEQLDFKMLLPLINETALKLGAVNPTSAQTGPARRNDKTSIQKHLELLNLNQGHADLYQLISEQIIQKYHGKL